MKRIKTFALFESDFSKMMDSQTAAAVKDLFDPYVSFPELYTENFMTWHYLTQGWSNYSGYVDYVKPAQPLSETEFENYRKSWGTSPLFTSGNQLFNQLLGWILKSQFTKLENDTTDLHSWSPEKMSEEFKRPLDICEVLHALLHGEFKGPGWSKIY